LNFTKSILSLTVIDGFLPYKKTAVGWREGTLSSSKKIKNVHKIKRCDHFKFQKLHILTVFLITFISTQFQLLSFALKNSLSQRESKQSCTDSRDLGWFNAKIANVVSAISFQWKFRGHSTEIVGINSPEPLEITASRINVAKESEVYKSKRSFSVYQSDNRW